MNKLKVAILYQSKPPPEIDGIVKPMKEGGYSDSGADIALAIRQNNIQLITPVDAPKSKNDFDWVFPDSEDGIKKAIKKGANLFWLNTVLYASHPILKFKDKNILVVGQKPRKVEIFDDKFFTNNLLRKKGLPITLSYLSSSDGHLKNDINFPAVIKPVRGRGSQGVLVVQNNATLKSGIINLVSSKKYGNKVIVEEFLPGKEITITIMPPGNYIIENEVVKKIHHWSLPSVERFNHIDGIAPYNGVVAVVNNSRIVPNNELNSTAIKEISQKCELAAKIIDAMAPIRIDCRKNIEGKYQIFDLNMKPNMTGTSREHRKDQDSLTMIAAKGIGWNFKELILNILSQYWRLTTT
jgi:hypothetical protein